MRGLHAADRYTGKPPLWTPLQTAQRLDEDDGTYYRDPNAAKFPSFPTEPAVQAILRMHPHFSFSEVDIFACGSTMGNLVRLAMRVDKPFRFDIESIGNTVLFVRRENLPTEIIPNVRGYGHTFPEQYTTWEPEVKGSETHQRVVEYNLAGLKCLVRFEVDGYHGEVPSKDGIVESKDTDSSPDPDALAKVMETTVFNQAPEHACKALRVETGGSIVSQEAIFDLKTRSGKWGKQVDMGELLPALYIKQIPNVIIAYHDGGGLFHDIQEQKIQARLGIWEVEFGEAIDRLAVLLRRILKIVKDNKGTLLEAYSPSVGRLEIRKRTTRQGTEALPPKLKARLSETAAAYNADDDICLQPGQQDLEDDDSSSTSALEDFTACSEGCGYCGKCSY